MLYFVTPQEGAFPGVSRLFDETIAVVGGEHIYLSDLHKVTKEDTTIFGAWSPAYAIALHRAKGEKIIHWASPLLQTDLSGVEPQYLLTILQLLDKGVIDKFWVIDEKNYKILKDKKGVFYAPAPVDIESLTKFAPSNYIEKNNIAMFFPWCPRKNILAQLGAVALLKNHSKVHGNNIPKMYKDFAEAVGINIIDHGWMPESDYYNQIKEMYLGLHATLSEAFGYGVADFLALGKPVLISESIADNFYIYPESDVYDYLVVRNVDDASEIAEKIKRILELGEEEYRELCDKCLEEIKMVAWVNNGEVRTIFDRII